MGVQYVTRRDTVHAVARMDHAGPVAVVFPFSSIEIHTFDCAFVRYSRREVMVVVVDVDGGVRGEGTSQRSTRELDVESASEGGEGRTVDFVVVVLLLLLLLLLKCLMTEQ